MRTRGDTWRQQGDSVALFSDVPGAPIAFSPRSARRHGLPWCFGYGRRRRGSRCATPTRRARHGGGSYRRARRSHEAVPMRQRRGAALRHLLVVSRLARTRGPPAAIGDGRTGVTRDEACDTVDRRRDPLMIITRRDERSAEKARAQSLRLSDQGGAGMGTARRSRYDTMYG